MKQFFFFLLLLPWIASAQDCQVKSETDAFTRETRLSTGFTPLRLSSLSIDADKKEFDFFFAIEGTDKCFDDNSTVSVFFDGTKQRNIFRNSGSMNCEGLFHFTVRNGPETPFHVKRFSTQKVDRFVFSGNNKKETIITLTPAQQEAIMHAATCIAAEAKKLAN